MGDWDKINPDMKGTQPESNTPKEDDVAPVKLGKRAVGLVLVVAMLLGIILIVVLQSCSVQKKVKVTSPSPTPEITISETNETTGNTGEIEPEFSENTVENESSTSCRDQNSNSVSTAVDDEEDDVETTDVKDLGEETNKDVVSNETTEKVPERLSEVAEPVLGELKSTTAMISSKKIYNLDNTSYAYSITLVLLTGENETTSVEYFCPKKTFDAVSTADSVTAQYQVDSNGIVSIATISN